LEGKPVGGNKLSTLDICSLPLGRLFNCQQEDYFADQTRKGRVV